MSFDQQLRSDRLDRRAGAVQRKIERGGSVTNADRRVMQAKLSRAVQAMSDLPSGAQVVPGGAPDSGAVTSAAQSMAASMASSHGGGLVHPPDLQGLLRSQVSQAMANSLQPRSITQTIPVTQGINSNWTVTITFGIAGPGTPQSQGTGQTTLGTSGTGGTQTTSGTQTTDTGTAGGTVGGKDGPNATAGGSSATQSSNSTQNTASGTGSSSTQTTDNLQRLTAQLQAEIHITAELDMSGSDYVNPLKWGLYAGEALDPIQPQTQTVSCGTIVYQVSGGIAAPGAAPAAGGH